jgi:GTPase SAR1 family protein
LGLGFLGFCLVKALSDKYKVTITVHKEIGKNKSVEWLSKTPQDSNVIVRTSPHLAETQPHNDQKLQDWDTPNQEQINKLLSYFFMHCNGNFIFVRQRFNQF